MRAGNLFVPLAVAGVLGLALGQAGDAGEKGKKKVSTMKVGDKAPSFEVMDDQGKTWKSGDVVGKKVAVFFFFPAALTGG
jgi:cytochrome oxidase Cu insertion factor (SCO1/SenC/PrrC family)